MKMQNSLSNQNTPLMRSSSRNKGMERNSSNLRSPQQLGQSSSAASLINYRLSQSALAKGLGSQQRLRLEKENVIKRQRDMSADTLQKRLDSFFASTRNFIYSATKMKSSMSEAIQQVDQQIDFNIKLFETDKQSVERCLNSLESQLFNLKDTQAFNFRSTTSNISHTRNPLNNRIDEVFSQTQNHIESNYLNQIRRENRNLKYEMSNLKDEINKIHSENISTFKSQDQILLSELEALKKQMLKTEKKASERKICIKKLYSILENKEKELEEFKNYQKKYPLGAVVNMISQMKKYDSSKKMQSYIEMAVKEVKLNKLLLTDVDTLTKQKRIEIEEMIHFLKVELKEIIKYFANLVSSDHSKTSKDRPERCVSPPQGQNIQFMASSGFTSPVQHNQDNGNFGAPSSLQFIRTNGFSQQQQQSRDGSAFTSPSNLKIQQSTSSQKINKNDKTNSNSYQKIGIISPTNKQMNGSLGQGFNNEDFQYVLKEQVEYVRKKYLTHFVEMLAQLNIHVDNLCFENKNEESDIVLKLREEFSKIASKHTGYQSLVQELRQRIEQKEQEIKERHVDIDNLKQQVIQIEEKAENNPKINKLEEQVQQYKQDIKERNESKRQLQVQITQLEEVKNDNERRERLYLEDIDNLKDQLFLVLDNLKNMMEYFGIIEESQERNLDGMLDCLREYLAKQIEKIHLHKNVFEDMEKKIIDSQEEIENLNYQNGELAKQIDDLDDINRSLKDEIEILSLKNQEGDHLEQGIRDKIIQLQNENHILKKNQIDPEQLEKLESDKSQTIAELNERNNAIINMKTEIQDLESKIREKEKQIKTLQSELADTEGEKSHQSKIVKSLEQYQIDKKAKHDEIIEKVIEMEKIQKLQNKEKLKLEEDVKRFKEREIKLEVQIEKLKKQGDDKNQDVFKKVKDLEKANQISNQKVEEQRNQISSLQNEITDLQKNISCLQNQQNTDQQELQNANEIELAQVQFSQQKYIQQLLQEKEDAVVAERTKYEREIQAIRHKDESEEFISEDKYFKVVEQVEEKNQQIIHLQSQLQELETAIQQTREQVNEERLKWQAEVEEKAQVEAANIEKRIESEKRNIADQFEKLLKDQADQFNYERTQSTDLFEKEVKAIENKYKQHEEDYERENKKLLEISQMELNGMKESNEEYKQAIENLKIQLKQAITRENDLKSESENLKTKIEVIESNTSAENKTIVNGLQSEKRQLEQNILSLKKSQEQGESTISQLNQKIHKLQEENENISLERSNLIREFQNSKDQTEFVKQEDDQKVQQLEQTIQEKTYCIQQLENEVSNWKVKVEQLNEETKMITQESIQLNHKITELQQYNQQKDKRIESLQKKQEEQILQLKKEHQANLEEVIHKSQGQIVDSFKEKIITLEQQVITLNDQIKQKDQLIESNHFKYEDTLNNQKKNDEAKLNNALNQAKDEQVKQIAILQQQITLIKEESNQSEVIINKLEDELTQSTHQIQQLQGVIHQMTDKDTQQQEQISTIQEALQQNIIEIEQLNKQIEQLNKENEDLNIVLLEERQKNITISGQGKQTVTENQEIFDFEDFTDDMASQHANEQKQRQDKEKRAELTVPSIPSIGASVGLRLNLGSIQSNFDNDAERIHIKRNLEDIPQSSKQQQQQQQNKEQHYDSFDEDDDENDGSSQGKSKFKDQLIQEYGKQIEVKNAEISDLKQQIDYMYADIEDQKGYIAHLENFIEETKANFAEQLKQLELQINLQGKQESAQTQQIKLPSKNSCVSDEGSVSPNTKILKLKTKLADVEADHENESISLNQQIINLKDENKKMKLEMQEIIQANDDLEARVEYQENKILDLQDNQHGEGAEEQIGQLHEQLDKLKQKVRRHEEDMTYLQQVNKNLNNQIEELQKKQGNKQLGSESGQSKDDDDYEGGLVKELGKTTVGVQFKKQSNAKIQQVVSSYNEMQDQDFENDQEEEDIEFEGKRPKTMNTEEAEQYETRLINEKIVIQQQIAELKNDFETIQTEDQIHIQELQRKLELNKKQISLLHEKSQKSNKQKHELAQLKDKYLNLQQQYKELKEEKEKVSIEKQGLQAQLVSPLQSPQNNSKKPQSSVSNTEQIDMLKLSLADAQSQLKLMKIKYNKGIQKIKSMIEAPSFSATQPAETEEDIIVLAEQLASTHQQRIQQIQLQAHHHSEGISYKSQIVSHEDNKDDIDEKKQITDITSLKALVFYSQKLESIVEEALLNKILDHNESIYKKDLTSEQFEKIQQYLRILDDFKVSISEKQKEYEQLLEKVEVQAEEIEKLKRPNSTSNHNFLQKRSQINQQQQDPFQLNDFENIKEDFEGHNNNNNNESSFISMSEQIIKELEGANTKTPQNQASLNQQSQIQKQHEDDVNKLMKENSELKASKDYYATRQDDLLDELRAKEEIIQTTESINKNLKKEIRKLRESTEAVSQKEHLKTIFIQFVIALSDKKKYLEADNFLGIIFSMLGISDIEKEEIINSVAKKPADKKKSITQLLTQK